MEIIKSNQGKGKLCYEGHLYVQKITKKDWIRWVCFRSRTVGCKGALTSSDTYENPRSFVDHNHSADVVGVEVIKLRSKIKTQAKHLNTNPKHVLAQCLQDAPDEVRARLGRLETCKRDVRRQQRGILPKKIEPYPLCGLTITDPRTLTTTEGTNHSLSTRTKIPFFGNKFSPKKIPSRRSQSLSNLNLDSTQMKQEFGIDCVPAKINLGGSEMAFEDGQWIPVNGFGAASHQEMMLLRKKNEQLQNENNFLRLKVESLLDMLTETTVTSHLQNEEISQLKTLVKTGRH